MEDFKQYVVVGAKSTVWDANEQADESITHNRGRGDGRTIGQTVALSDATGANLVAAGVVVLKDDYVPRGAADAAVQLAEAKAEKDAMAKKLAELDGDDKPKNKGGRPRKAASE